MQQGSSLPTQAMFHGKLTDLPCFFVNFFRFTEAEFFVERPACSKSASILRTFELLQITTNELSCALLRKFTLFCLM